ncbi:hypothetical protein RUND412_004244 [Rhizina undulata]
MSRFLKFFTRSEADRSAESSSTAPSDRKYGCKILDGKENTNAAVDIVFIHGLTGDRTATWTASNGVCWPRDLLPKTVPEARVIMFGYDADVANFWNPASQNTVNDHANALVNGLGMLREKDKTSDRPLIFVVHSLGGLVIQDALLVSRDSVEGYRQKVVKATRAVIFLGTPHCGSTMASWAEFAANIIGVLKPANKKIIAVLNPGSDALAGIQDRFHTMLRRSKDEESFNITLVCFYEELYVAGIGKKVVPDTSAKLSGHLNEGIHANHMDMTKFLDEEDPGYEKVSSQIWRCIQEISNPPKAAAQKPVAKTGMFADGLGGGMFANGIPGMPSGGRNQNLGGQF